MSHAVYKRIQEELLVGIGSRLGNDALLELREGIALRSIVHADLVVRETAQHVVHDQEARIGEMKTILLILLRISKEEYQHDGLDGHLLGNLLGDGGRRKVHANAESGATARLVRENIIVHVLVHVGHLRLHVVQQSTEIGRTPVSQLKDVQRRAQLVLLQNVSGDGLGEEGGEEFHSIHVVHSLFLRINHST